MSQHSASRRPQPASLPPAGSPDAGPPGRTCDQPARRRCCAAARGSAPPLTSYGHSGRSGGLWCQRARARPLSYGSKLWWWTWTEQTVNVNREKKVFKKKNKHKKQISDWLWSHSIGTDVERSEAQIKITWTSPVPLCPRSGVWFFCRAQSPPGGRKSPHLQLDLTPEQSDPQWTSGSDKTFPLWSLQWRLDETDTAILSPCSPNKICKKKKIAILISEI